MVFAVVEWIGFLMDSWCLELLFLSKLNEEADSGVRSFQFRDRTRAERIFLKTEYACKKITCTQGNKKTKRNTEQDKNKQKEIFLDFYDFFFQKQ